MNKGHGHKAHAHKHDDELDDVEKSLFSEDDTEPEVGLLPKKGHHAHRTHHTTSRSHHTHSKEIRFSIPVPDRDLMMKVGIGLIILVLLVFFFYNPFYCKFSWNDCTVTTVVEDDDDVADEEDIDVADDEDEVDTADAVDVTLDEDDEDDSDVVEQDDDSEDTDEEDSDTISLSGDITFDFTKLPDTSEKDWGWTVDKVYFSVDNQDESFVPKVRIKIYEGTEMGSNIRADQVRVYPELDVGKKLISSIEVLAQIGDLDEDAIVVMELKDEGSKTGSAGDKTIDTVKKTIPHP